jgi:predicted DNA-binding transcriptional regulator AlpA
MLAKNALSAAMRNAMDVVGSLSVMDQLALCTHLIQTVGLPKLILREAEVSKTTGLSASSIRNRNDDDSRFFDRHFPQPRSLGGGTGRSAKGWLAAEVYEWCVNLPLVADVQQYTNRRRRLSAREHQADGETGFRL